MPSTKPRPDARRALFGLLAPIVTGAGYDLEDISIATVGRRSVVRLVVDADERPDLDGISTVSRLVSDVLDVDPAAAVLGEDYLLEVTTPGVERPLVELRHWTRATGRLVTVAIGGRQVTGRVASVGPEGVRFDVDGRSELASWDALGPGRVSVEFNRPADSDGRSTRPSLTIVDGG